MKIRRGKGGRECHTRLVELAAGGCSNSHMILPPLEVHAGHMVQARHLVHHTASAAVIQFYGAWGEE